MRQHKYGAKRSEVYGYSFASQLERNVFLLLKAMEQKGEIEIERVQDQIMLSEAAIMYKPDFKVRDLATGESYHVEAKGFETPEWRIKRRLWIAYGPNDLHIYKGSGTRIKLHEVIKPKNKAGA